MDEIFFKFLKVKSRDYTFFSGVFSPFPTGGRKIRVRIDLLSSTSIPFLFSTVKHIEKNPPFPSMRSSFLLEALLFPSSNCRVNNIYSSFLLLFKPNKWNLNSYLFYFHLLSTSKHINRKTYYFPFLYHFSSLSLFISFSFSPGATKNNIKVSTPPLLPLASIHNNEMGSIVSTSLINKSC